MTLIEYTFWLAFASSNCLDIHTKYNNVSFSRNLSTLRDAKSNKGINPNLEIRIMRNNVVVLQVVTPKSLEEI